jgi:hypothetical protein
MAQKRLDDTTLRRLNELFQESLALYDSEHGYQPGTRGSYDKTSVPSFDGSRAASYPRLLARILHQGKRPGLRRGAVSSG